MFGVTNTRQIFISSKFFYGLPIGSFLTFKGPLTSLAKVLLKYQVSFILIFQQCLFKLSVSLSMTVSLHISSMLKSIPWLLRWFLVLLSSYRQTRYTQHHKWTRYFSTFPLPSQLSRFYSLFRRIGSLTLDIL